jgi:hypothetical protein
MVNLVLQLYSAEKSKMESSPGSSLGECSCIFTPGTCCLHGCVVLSGDGIARVLTEATSTQGDRMWEFAVPILFMEIFVDTLLPSAFFSLVMYATCLVAIPSVGRQLDAANRWKAMRLAIVLENATIIASTGLLGAMLLLTDADGLHKPEWTWTLTLLFVGTLVCGGVGQVLSEAQTLGIERDWVVIIAQSSGVERSTALAGLNTILRRIDLACKLLGPLAFGIIMDFAGRDPTTRAMIGASTVAIWNGLSTPLEYFMTRDIYKLVPGLATKEEEELGSPGDEEQRQAAKSTLSRYTEMWRNYTKHPVFLLSFSYCSLYMTVLDNGSLNTAYLKWRGVPDSLLGSSRGAGAVFGLLGTVLFPYLRRSIPRLERVAVLSIWLFWLSNRACRTTSCCAAWSVLACGFGAPILPKLRSCRSGSSRAAAGRSTPCRRRRTSSFTCSFKAWASSSTTRGSSRRSCSSPSPQCSLPRWALRCGTSGLAATEACSCDPRLKARRRWLLRDRQQPRAPVGLQESACHDKRYPWIAQH